MDIMTGRTYCKETEHVWYNPEPTWTGSVCAKCNMDGAEFEDSQPEVEIEIEVSNDRPF